MFLRHVVPGQKRHPVKVELVQSLNLKGSNFEQNVTLN